MGSLNEDTELKYTPLSIPVLKSCAVRGGRPAFKSETISKSGRHITSTLAFSIQCATHIDLPEVVDTESDLRKMSASERSKIQILIPQKFGPDFEKVLSDYHKPRAFKKTVILDFTKRKTEIDDWLQRNQEDLTLPARFLKSDMDGNAFYEIYNDKLRIDKDDIKSTIENKKIDIERSFVIFKTGWEQFYEGGRDLNHPMFEGWHISLVHPFLDEEAVKYLIEKNVYGVGSDSPSLESPAYYFDPHFCMPYLREVFDKILKGLPEYRPLHLHFLSRGLYIIENLVNLKKIATDEGYVTGCLHIFPYPLGTILGTKDSQVPDALLTVAYFEKDSKG